MDPSIIIQRLGGVSAVARMFDIKPSSVSEWQTSKFGIPKARMQFIALARPDALRPINDDERASEAGNV